MNLKHGIIRGTISLGSARALVSIFNAIGIVILARLLTPADFGIVAISTAVLGVTMALTEASLQPALVQCRVPTRDHLDTVWTMSLIRAGIILGLFVCGAWPLSVIYGDPRLVQVLMVSGVTGAFMEFYNPRITLATRGLEFRALAAFQIMQKFGSLAAAIGLALTFRSFWAIIIGNAAGALVVSLCSYIIIPYRPRFTLSRSREIWGFSQWMFFTQLCDTLNWRFDQLVLGLNVTKAQLGFYSVADNLAVIPSRELSTPICSALFAGLTNLAGQRDKLRSSYLRAQSAVAMIAVPAAAGLALVAEPAVRLLLGEKWIASAVLVRILAITYGLDMFVVAVRPLGMAMGETRLLFMRQLAGLCVRIPLILIGVFTGGMIGAALGRTLGNAINCVISYYVAKQLLGVTIREQLKRQAVTIVGVIAMAAVVLALQAKFGPLLAHSALLSVAVFGAAGAVTYCGTILALWCAGIRPGETLADVVGAAAAFLPIGVGRRMAAS
jgi:O-antigen/teichoic acid export membrane protein